MNVNANRHVLEDQDSQAKENQRMQRELIIQNQQRNLQNQQSQQGHNISMQNDNNLQDQNSPSLMNSPYNQIPNSTQYGSQNNAQQYPLASYPYQTYPNTAGSNFPVFDFGLLLPNTYQAIPQRSNYQQPQKPLVSDYLKDPKNQPPVPPSSVSMAPKGSRMSILSNGSETNHGLYNVTEPVMDESASTTLLPLSLGIDPQQRQNYINEQNQEYIKDQRGVYTNDQEYMKDQSMMYMKDPSQMQPFVKQEISSPMETSIFPKPPKKFRSSSTKSDPSLSTIQSDQGRPRIKSAHNVIEQRYRNKINDKFKALQDSVPTLRIVTARKQKRATSANASAHDEDFDSEHSDDDIGYSCGDNDLVDLEGLEPARKLNKGTILAKSIEYIKFLELKNDRMTHEHQQLLIKARMLGLVVDQSSLEQDNLPNI